MSAWRGQANEITHRGNDAIDVRGDDLQVFCTLSFEIRTTGSKGSDEDRAKGDSHDGARQGDQPESLNDDMIDGTVCLEDRQDAVVMIISGRIYDRHGRGDLRKLASTGEDDDLPLADKQRDKCDALG